MDELFSSVIKLAQNEYKKYNHKSVAMIHSNFCRKFGFACTEKMPVLRNDKVRLLCGFLVQIERVECNRLHTTVIYKKK
uniref:Uncharacterized protein n=1 Tax=Octopus bimaculoides TaxID=37653 RepID=A0A0L8G0N7_OCTBM